MMSYGFNYALDRLSQTCSKPVKERMEEVIKDTANKQGQFNLVGYSDYGASII